MALSLDGHTSGATSVTGSTYQTGTLTTSTGSGQIVACIFNNSSGVTSVRGVEKLKRTEGRQAEAAGEPMVKCAVGCAPATESVEEVLSRSRPECRMCSRDAFELLADVCNACLTPSRRRHPYRKKRAAPMLQSGPSFLDCVSRYRWSRWSS
jgi:ribosomal protein L37E